MYVLGAELAGHGGKSIEKTLAFAYVGSKNVLRGGRVAIAGR